MRALLLLLLALDAAAMAAGAEQLSVKADPANPGRVVVGSTPETSGEPAVVVYAPDGRPSAYYRSPDSAGFGLCAFLRYAGLSRTPGPIDVTVWRGDLSAPLRLEYDGRSCAANPPPTGERRPSRLAPLAIPTMAAPPPTPTEAEAREAFASARVERIVLSAEGKGHRFLVELDRDVRLPPRTQVIVKKLFRMDFQKDVPGAAARLPVRTVERGLDWKTQPGLLRFEPPLRKGEKLRLSFEIEDRLFDQQTVTYDPS